MATNNGLTIYCPTCGKAGFKLVRASDGAQLEVKVAQGEIRRNEPIENVLSRVQMVCANPDCQHVLEDILIPVKGR